MTDKKSAPPESGAKKTSIPVILQVLPALNTGGVERGVIEVARAIVEAGGKAIVASSGGAMVRELDRIGALHITLPLASKNPFTIRRNIKRLVKVIKEHAIDIVHARSRAPAWSAYWAAQKAGVHFVTTYHGTYNGGMLGLKDRYNSVMAKGERVIAISEFIRRHIEATHPIDPTKIRVIHRGVDLERFDAACVSPERVIQLANLWRIPESYKVVMLPGRLTRWKGQTVLIEALAELRRKDVRCLLVGSDQGRTAYTEELKALITKLDLMDVVHIVGDCKDMPAAYMLTDVVVLASTDPEAFGRVIVEAEAMGRPVVATNNGAAPETVIEGQTGRLVPPNDPKAMAEALAWALDLSPERRDEVAAASVALARSQFSSQKMCAETLDVYREVLALPIEVKKK